MKKRLLGILFSFALILAMMPALSRTVYAEEPEIIEYLDENGNVKTVSEYTLVDESTSEFASDGFYVVPGDVEISHISVKSKANLILCDHSELTIAAAGSDGIDIGSQDNCSLTIYAQSAGENMGVLDITGSSGIRVGDNCSLKVAGGKVTASGTADAGYGIDVIGFGEVTIGKDMRVRAGSSEADAQPVTDISTWKHKDKWVRIAPVPGYPLWVSGVRVTSENRDDVLGDADEGATAVYAPAEDGRSGTLTLTDASITGEGTFGEITANIYSETIDLTIVLNGRNVVDSRKGNAEHPANFAVCVNREGSLTVQGTGELTASGNNYAVSAYQDCEFRNVRVSATSVYGSAVSAGSGKCMISGGEVTAEGGGQCGIYAGDGITVTGGTVTAAGSVTGIYTRGDVVAGGGTIIASEDGGTSANAAGAGTAAGRLPAGISADSIVIRKDIAGLTASGTEAAIRGTVKNEVVGTGWTGTAGAGGKAKIDISSEGQVLDNYRKVRFPSSSAKVTEAPAARDLTACGTAQELVTAGTAEGGTMQYAIGGDATAAPADGWSTSIPEGTDAGVYYVWYKAAGDDSHNDSDAAWVKARISAPAPAAVVLINTKTVSANTLNAAAIQSGASFDSAAVVVLGKNVKKISKDAFRNYRNVKTLVVQSRKLKKSSVKKSLRGSAVTKIRVRVGKKKTNRKYVRKYKGIFTKKNCGRKVKVSL